VDLDELSDEEEPDFSNRKNGKNLLICGYLVHVKKMKIML